MENKRWQRKPVCHRLHHLAVLHSRRRHRLQSFLLLLLLLSCRHQSLRVRRRGW
jgi:hypothetical protein